MFNLCVMATLATEEDIEEKSCVTLISMSGRNDGLHL